ncbi:LysM domain-containing protein [Nocardioides exalbidus]|uniref:LysM domain-containing protein n=1 Tax=Nocardioides exalbidus TaxID=402596 RepID=A0A1H4UD53_9ACTN|nr:LysM domain-containing protein [Nocardioides exalbidus]SEC66667.1 LysM domain-containing protein [Nocardioides exalbidus]
MSRGNIKVWRPLAVWLGVTGAGVATATAVPGAWVSALDDSSAVPTADVVVAGCTTALAAALGWLWVVTTATVVELMAGSTRVGGGTTRRLVLVACGAAVVAGAGVPALAADDPAGAELLGGLPMPERAVARADRPRPAPEPAPARARPANAVADHYVVRPGDSLWSVAQAHPGGDADIDRRWREIWQANRDVVGDDPDLILPGQALRLPAPEKNTDSQTDTDGDR